MVDRKGKGRDLGFAHDSDVSGGSCANDELQQEATSSRRTVRRQRRKTMDSVGYMTEPHPTSRHRSGQTSKASGNPYSHTSYRTRYPPLPTLLSILLLALIALLSPTSAAPDCLRFADFDSINALLTSGGPGTKVFLCPNKVYRLSGPIIFTAADQELATAGYPTDASRAVLRGQGHLITAIQGDCRRCKGVSLRSLVVDGNRKKLGRVKPDEESTGMVVLGGNEGQVVRDCVLKDPRGFTALHIREGDKLQCKGAQVVNNLIGPVGEEYVPAKDGPDPEGSSFGRPLADGLTLACRDSVVKGNTFVDNTDAGIVLYCAPGSLVSQNKITSSSLSSMAGILMIDSSPFDGDYTGVKVSANTLEANGAHMRIGIGMGAAVLSDDTDTVLKGAVVSGNTIKGDRLSYGIAATGLEDWTIEDNKLEGTYSGKPSPRCFEDVELPAPAKMVIHKASVKGPLQPGFVDKPFQYIACVDPLSAPGEVNPPVTPLQGAVRADANDDIKAPNNPAKPQPAPAPPANPPPAPAGNNDKTPQKPIAIPGAAAATPPDQAKREDKPAHAHGHGHANGLPHDVEPRAQELLPFFDTGSTMMDEILEHSLARVLEAIENLEGKVEAKGGNTDSGKGGKSDQLNGVMSRVQAAEQRQQGTLDLAVGVRGQIKQWAQSSRDLDSHRTNALNEIYSHLIHHLLLNPEIDAGELRDPPPGWPNPPIPLGETEEFRAEEHERWLKWVAQEEIKRQKRIALGLESEADSKPYNPNGGGGGVKFLFIGLFLGLGAVVARNFAKRYLGTGSGRLSLNGGGGKYVHLNGSASGGSALSDSPTSSEKMGNGHVNGYTAGYAPNQTNAHVRRRTGSMGAEERGMIKVVSGWGWGWWGGGQGDRRKEI